MRSSLCSPGAVDLPDAAQPEPLSSSVVNTIFLSKLARSLGKHHCTPGKRGDCQLREQAFRIHLGDTSWARKLQVATFKSNAAYKRSGVPLTEDLI